MTASLPPGLLEYDDGHTVRLAVAILQAIVTTSTADKTTVLRGREIRDAMAMALAEIVALEPHTKTRRLIDDHAHIARRLVAHHRSNPKLHEFTSRMNRVDLNSGGRA
jgi:hypothetical protein